MSQSTHLLFKSSHFHPEVGEDDATNPGIFGKRLARWLAHRVVSPDITDEDLIAEDFGWCVRVPNDDFSLYLACSSTDKTATEWRVFAFAEGGIFKRLLRRARPGDAAEALFVRLRSLLESSPQIEGLREEHH